MRLDSDTHSSALRKAPWSVTEAAVLGALERIEDPCSAASGAPAGLVSMGLVRGIDVKGPSHAARVEVTLCITEPGCMMGAVFKKTAEQNLADLPGIDSVEVEIDHGHVWDPGDMTPAYRKRLERVRATRLERMKQQMASPAEGTPRRVAQGGNPDS